MNVVLEKKEFEKKKSTVVTLRARYKSAYDTFVSAISSGKYESEDSEFVATKEELCNILKEIEDIANELLSHINMLDGIKKELIKCKNVKLPAASSSLQTAVEKQFDAWSDEKVSDAKKAKLTVTAGKKAEAYLSLLDRIAKFTDVVNFTEEEAKGGTLPELNELLEFTKTQKVTLEVLHISKPAGDGDADDKSQKEIEEPSPVMEEKEVEKEVEPEPIVSTSNEELEALMEELLNEGNLPKVEKPKKKFFGFGR